MKVIRKRRTVAFVAVVGALALAGAAVAAGPPHGAPRLGMQQHVGQGYGVMAGGAVMDAAASYLGMSETALAAERHDGKSLAQIAVAQGKSAAGLEQALVVAFSANLDKAVAANRITSAQAAQVLATFKTQVKAMIERTAVGPPAGRGGGPGLCRGGR